MSSLSKYDKLMLGKPSVDDCFCIVCGRYATNHHHVIEKGIGGVPKSLERLIPTVMLCGNGNLSGCHGLVHHKKLHIYWDRKLDWWVWAKTDEEMDDFECWEKHRETYRLANRPAEWKTFGGRK